MPLSLSRYKQSLIKKRDPINLTKEYYNIWGWKIKTRTEVFASQYTYIFDTPLKTDGIITEIKIKILTKPIILKIKIFEKISTQFIFKNEYIFNINTLKPCINTYIPVKNNYKIGIYESTLIGSKFIYRDPNTNLVYYTSQDVTSDINMSNMNCIYKKASIQCKIKYKKDKYYAI